MGLMDPETERKLRKSFKYVNHAMMLMWHLGLGYWLNLSPKYGGRIMVLVHTGRKSGRRRRNNVNYSMIDGDIYCTAGFGGVTDWYRNILANPAVEVWLPNSWYTGVAEDVSYTPNRIPILRQVLIDSGFAARSMGIDPDKLDDDELAKITPDYRLVRIRRTAARTGDGGPGSMSWIWPLTTLFLLGALIFRPRHDKKS